MMAEQATSPKLLLASGIGKSETHVIAFDDGRPNPAPYAGKPYSGVTGAQIAAMITKPPCVEKTEAQWIIPSTYLEHDARSHTAQRKNGMFWMLVLDVDTNDLDLEFVVQCLQKLCPTASIMAYSTKSSAPGNRKWRAIIPLANGIPGDEYEATEQAFYDCLIEASQGVLIPDRSLARPGQVFFLPNRGDHYEYSVIRATKLVLDDAHPVTIRKRDTQDRLAQATREAQARQASKTQERAALGIDAGTRPADAFNERHSVPDLLTKYGYKRAGQSNSWQSPHQKSGSYATRAADDYWVSLSGSDADMGLGAASANGNRYGDAFDLYVHFEHGGAFDKAVRAYAQEAGLSRSGPIVANGSSLSLGTSFSIDTGFSNSATHAPNFDHAPAPTANDPAPTVAPWRLQTAAEFTADFVAPEYIIDGVVQRGRLYTLTAPTGSGKTAVMLYAATSIAEGTMFYDRDVECGDVIFMAGENPDDVRARMIATMEFNQINPATCRVHFIPGTFSIRADMELLKAAAEKLPNLVLVVVDTFAAYFDGDDENSNAQALDFARVVRKLTVMQSKPAVIMPAHPVKNATRSNLSPKGGSSLVNEVDGNLTLWNEDGMIALHWQTKFRGPEFEPLNFEFQRYETDAIRDAKGRRMPTVLAKPLLMGRAMELSQQKMTAEDKLLLSIEAAPAMSVMERGAQIGLKHKTQVRRMLSKLAQQKLIRMFRTNWELTKDGERAVEIIKNGGTFAPEI